MSVNKKMITARNLAEELDLSVETIWRYTREEKIPFIDLGNRQYRYKLEEVVKSLAGSRVRETGTEYKNDSEGFTYQDYLKIPGEIGKMIIKEKRIDGSPVLAIEIISPYNTRKDRLQKMRIYQKSGIENYWLVDPAEKTMECFALRDSIYALLVSGMDDDILEHPNFKGLSIKLEELWHNQTMP